MADSLRHRGPDDGGVWVDPEVGVALGHRRLSVVDRSSQGRQPMQSACNRYVIAFNGEIYNFQAVRRDLEHAGVAPPPWRGHSDTEVMLAAISHWGLEGAIGRFVGMFAFALWCRKERIPYEGFFQPTAIRGKWDQHFSGGRNWQDELWDVLMFQAWLDAQTVPSTVEPVHCG